MATSTTRKTAAKKAAAPVAPAEAPEAPVVDEAPVETPAEEPAEEPAVEDEAPEAPRQTPATASLEAPENRIPPSDGVEPKSVIKDSSGQLSVDMLTQGPSEVRSELYDAATKKAPSPDEVFDLEFPNGQAVICQIRLCENLWITGQNEPMSRLVMARGQRTDRAYAEQIIAILKQQVAGDDESTPAPLEV